jgi:carbon starvation protein
LICTLTAGYQKLFHENPRIGFLAHANKFQAAAAEGQLLAPAKSAAQMHQIIVNDYIDASLAAIFMAVVLSVLFYGIRACLQALKDHQPSTHEADTTAPIGSASA